MRGIWSAAIVLVAMSASPGALPPAGADEPDVYGLITSDERQEISSNGWRHCETLDAADPPVTPADVNAIIQGYLATGWDVESAGDIVWESVEAGCAEYVPQVEAVMDTYGPMS